MARPDPVAARIASLSAREIVDTLAPEGGLRRAVLGLFARVPSAMLGRAMARFDARTAEIGLSGAARAALEGFGAELRVVGDKPRGAALVVANHPGAYDALAVMASLERDDVLLVAAERAFLRALPNVARHLAFLEGDVSGRARALRRALSTLRRGGVVVQFGAGAIEPDARFADRAERSGAAPQLLLPWRRGSGLLALQAARCGAAVVPAFASGVHSARAKALPFVRWAERRGMTMLAPLVQATVPGFRDVVVEVAFGAPIGPAELARAPSDDARASIIRCAALSLAPRRR